MPSEPSLPAGAWPAMDSRHFGPAFEAFPVEAPFEVRPDLVKLAPADDWLRVDVEWRAMLSAKLAAVTGQTGSAGQNIMLTQPCDAGTQQRRMAAIMRVAGTLGSTDAGRRLSIERTPAGIVFGAAGYRCDIVPGGFRLHADRPDAVPLVRALAVGDEPAALLGSIAMSLQEDLVLMEQGLDGTARAVVFHVSFPSAWNPAEKLGQDLHALHAPVADNDLLQGAAPRLGKALLEKGPFVRWVWTVTTDRRWRAWPSPAASEGKGGQGPPSAAGAVAAAPVPVDQAHRETARQDPLYFRLERQTTMPLGEGYGLFLIRVQVRPLADVLAQPGRLEMLKASLRSMSTDMVRYKSLEAIRTRVLEM